MFLYFSLKNDSNIGVLRGFHNVFMGHRKKSMALNGLTGQQNEIRFKIGWNIMCIFLC